MVVCTFWVKVKGISTIYQKRDTTFSNGRRFDDVSPEHRRPGLDTLAEPAPTRRPRVEKGVRKLRVVYGAPSDT